MLTMKDLVSVIPTREDLVQAVRRRNSQSAMPAMWLIGLGALAGAGLALMMAPAPGRETRTRVRERMTQLRHDLGNGAKALKKEANNLKGKAEELVPSMRSETSRPATTSSTRGYGLESR